MRSLAILFAAVVGCAIAAGCYTGEDTIPISASSTAPTTAATAAQVSSTSISGLPCDVATILATSCASCHGAVPAGGAASSLVTYESLVAPSVTDPSRTEAQVSVARMQDVTSPMPPSAGSATDAAVLAAWVAAGAPKGSCDTAVAATVTYATATVCTSNTTWTSGNRGSTSMRPGGACIQCHDSGRGPQYSIAGTVYPTAHEPDDCYGATGSQVVTTDATGAVFTATANAAGNFYLSSNIQMPYTAKVVSGSKTLAMVGAQTDGDCNGCHTEQGTQKAPGRVMAP